MGAKTLQHQIKHTLIQKSRIGESRHLAKIELKEQQGENYKFGMATDTIHSIKTFDDYKASCERFCNWVIETKGVSKYTPLAKIEKYAPEYLETKEKEGLSLYSLKSYKSALGKLYGHEIDYKFSQQRTYDSIHRSRGEAVRDKNFSKENNKDLITICKATGGRREDIEKLTPNKFFEDRNGNMWVSFEQSKGGRDRVSPVLPAYQSEVREIIKEREQDVPIFDKVHSACDVHGYRREYARELYDLVKGDKAIREEFAKMYPARNEPNIKGDIYHSHSKEHPFKGNRDDIYIVSQALGHNRLEVSVNHYLK